MYTQVTEGIAITVDVFYQKHISNPLTGEYQFGYRVTIENSNSFGIRLKKRHWNIFQSQFNGEDGTDFNFEVEGEGVVGIQPVIAAEGAYEYLSGCKIGGDIGSMSGFFEMENLETGSSFQVQIPQVALIVPGKFN